MNKNETVVIEYLSKKIRPTLGGSEVEVEYMMTHKKYGRTNSYKVTCTISGIETCDVHLHSHSAEFMGGENTNDETLTEDAAMQLFDDTIEQ